MQAIMGQVTLQYVQQNPKAQTLSIGSTWLPTTHLLTTTTARAPRRHDQQQ
jgi:hypothetical protein